MVGIQALEGIQLVLVDDEPGVLRALSLLLMGLKCRVTALPSPRDVITYFESNPAPDAIISDLRMPEMTGIDLLFHLRNSGVTAPFILMSGHASAEEVATAASTELTAFLSKPFTPQELIKVLLAICPAVQRAANAS